MEKWEIALQKFLKKWENQKEVIGAIVCGSYITGNPSKHSDIDIHIILDSKCPWRERGNEIIDGILIEYFANSAKSYPAYLEEDYKKRKRTLAHMFCTGRVIFDKKGELKKLIQLSKRYLIKKYPKPSKTQAEIAKYHLWDMYDNLEEVFDAEGDEFLFVYYVDLEHLFEDYAKFLRYESISAHKMKRFLTNDKDKKKYKLNDFPDPEFVRMYVDAMAIKDRAEMMKEYKNLTNHVFTKMGGFNIDGWKIRSPAK